MVNALIIVDVQPTFCEDGDLPIVGGNACATRIGKFAAANHHRYDFIITTQDWHVDPGDHFSDNPDFVDTWPPHGVAGTAEAELHRALSGVPIDFSVRKGLYSAAYSGFEGETPEGATLQQVLDAEEVDSVDVVGLALSHCVKETALDAKKSGRTVRVLRDLTEPVSAEQGEEAVEILEAANISVVPSSGTR